jgi:tRNA(Ile)-lysidine synthase
MRLVRGSGIAGLAAMARESEREGVVITRPFLNIPKSQLIATLAKAKIGYADDPTNRDLSFTRPRIRSVMEGLAREGGDARNLARLAARLARANAAIEVLADGAARYLALRDSAAGPPAAAGALSRNTTTFEAAAFAGMPEEIRLRLLLRAIDRAGHEGPAQLGKVEALLAVLDQALRMATEERAAKRQLKPRARPKAWLKQTLAGAVITLSGGRIVICPAPLRRRRDG